MENYIPLPKKRPWFSTIFFIKQSTLDNPDDIVPDLTYLNSELNNIVFSSIEVKAVIKNLDSNKAAGPDKINNRLLIAAVDIISEPLTILFNRSVAEGIFPQIWKTAHVNPIYKKGPTDDCTNYRPISLLSCVGKVLERCIHSHVFSYLQNNHILTPSQSGFIAVNQLITIYNDICLAYDKGITTQSIFFDISKAFDRVWHKGLLKKLEAVGIRGNLHKWFTNYLENRKQAVVIKGSISNYNTITAGVPQGSVLGPLLFLIYINDIVASIESSIKLFADDTSMSLALRDPNVCADILNSDLRKISAWANQWKVKFNENKTELLIFKRDPFINPPLYFGSCTLSEQNSHKHLGLIFQNNCKWEDHIHSIIQKVTLLLSCLRSFKYKLSRKALEIMYKSFILPHFDYADIVWDNCTEILSNALEKLHLEGIRIILGSVKGTSHEALYKESGFCTLKERRKRHKLIQFHKMINSLCPAYLLNLVPPLISTINPYPRRRPFDRRVPACKTELYRHSYIPSTIALWNDLPNELKNNPSLSLLKKHLSDSDNNVPSSYYLGARKQQLLHCRLRLGMSDINYDLYRRHLLNDPTCRCGYPAETSEHFLLYCPTYNDIRTLTINKLDVHHREINTLLFGNDTLKLQDIAVIFSAVHSFIVQSNRL